MIGPETDVLIQVEHDHLEPVDPWLADSVRYISNWLAPVARMILACPLVRIALRIAWATLSAAAAAISLWSR